MALSRAQIQTAFQNSLGRAASTSDENSYFSVSQSGALSDAQIFSTISNSREADQIADPVIRFYQAAFGRVPDQAGLQNAENYVRAFSPTAATYQSLSNMFAQSTEFTNRFGTGTAVDAAYVQALYSTILNRSATSAEVDGYVSGAAGYTTRGGVLYAISQSSEAINLSNDAVNGFQLNAAQGQAVYTGTLYTAANGAPAGSTGQNFALTTTTDTLTGTAGNDIFRADNTTLQVTDTIRGNGGSDTFSYTDTSTNGVSPVAANVSGVTNISIRNLSASGVVAPTPGSAETAVVTFGALTSGQAITVNGLTVTATGTDLTASQVQQAYLAGTTQGSATVTGTYNTTAGTGYNLPVTGSSANSVSLTANSTGNRPDLTLTGNSGTSTLAITQGTAGTGGSGGTPNTDTVTAGNFVGAVNFVSDNSTSDVNVTGLTAGQTVGINGNGSTLNGSLTGNYGSSVTAAAINVSGGTTQGTITINGSGITSQTISSTGASNVLTGVTLAATTKNVTVNATSNLTVNTGITGFATGGTLAIAGAATSVNLGTTVLDANLTSVDASGLTAGGVTALLNTAAPTGFTFKGGAGNDVVTVTGGFTNTIANGAIDGGAGTADVINVTTAPLTSATGAAFTNFEVLRNSVAASTQNAAVVSGITAVQTNASGAGFSNLSAAQAAAAQILVTTANSTFALADATGTNDTLNLKLAPAANPATVINATGLTVAGFENLGLNVGSGLQSIFSSGTTLGTIDQVSFTSAANLKTIAISGAYAVNVDATNANALTSIDASQNTAGVVLTTPGAITNALSITGSSAADQITVTTLSSTGSIGAINAGAGNDLIKIGQGSIVATTSINGGAGTDTLELTDTGTVTIVDASFQNVTGIEKIVLDATTGLTFNVGGFANTLATGNGGVLDVTAANLAGASVVNAQGLTGTIKLVLNSTNTGSDTITTSVGGADSITIKGIHGANTIVINGGNNTAGVTIDTSQATSTAVVTANTITTGAGNDTIKVGDYAATITTGAGTDSVTLTGTNTVQSFNLNASGTSTTTNATSITGFNAAATNADVLDFTGTPAIQNSAGLSNGFTVTNGVATKTGASLTDFVAAVAASTSAGVSAFQFGTDTYVGYSDGSSATTGNDHIVKLVGLTGITAVSTTAGATTVQVA